MTRFRIIALGGLLTLVAAPLALAAGFGGSRCGGPGFGPPQSAAEATERAQLFADEAMERLDGTDEQRLAVDNILDANVPLLHDVHTEGAALREAFTAALQDDADPAELEKLRLEGLDLVDEGSQLMLDTLVSVSDVLTPEQRATLQRWHEDRSRWFGGHHMSPHGK